MREIAQEAIGQYLAEGMAKGDTAYYVIRRLIIEDELAPGQVLSERELAGLLGLSRTPVKSALMRLSYEGFVENRADGCALVTRMDIKDVMELYEVREGLECKAVELFTRRRDPDAMTQLLENHRQHTEMARGSDWVRTSELDNNTHLIIARGSLNKKLEAALAMYISQGLRMQMVGIAFTGSPRSFEHHDALVEAIRAGDAALAAHRMREHILDVQQTFKEYFMENYYSSR